MQLHFADDAQEPVFELKHKLKLYSGEDQQANQNPKKPVRRLDRTMLLLFNQRRAVRLLLSTPADPPH